MKRIRNYATSYKFNGKELDEETGLYYYGARYLHPKYAMWLSTDPMELKYPNGKPHNKFSEYKFIQINQYILSSYEKAQISKYKNGVVTYYGHKYSIPASVFTNSSNLDPHRGFYYKTGNKEQYGIEATGVAGRTFFWRLKL